METLQITSDQLSFMFQCRLWLPQKLQRFMNNAYIMKIEHVHKMLETSKFSLF